MSRKGASLPILPVVALCVAGLMPATAQAECLGPDCYKGLGVFLALVAAYGVGVVVLVILMILRRWHAAKIMALVLLLSFLAALPWLN